jgi:soluble lytic murein transglycosylase-like protein
MTPIVITAISATLSIAVAFTGAVYAVVSPPELISPIAGEKIAQAQQISPTATHTPTPTPTNTPTPTATPTPTPTVTPTPTSIPLTSEVLEGYFEKYAHEYSVDRDQLRKIASCESGFNSQARNGDYSGMFQFATRSWQAKRAQMNLDSNPDLRFNAEESIRTAAYTISAGGISAWPSCK